MEFFINKTLVKFLGEALVESIQPKYLSSGFYFFDMFGRFEKVSLFSPHLEFSREYLKAYILGSFYSKIHFILKLKFSGLSWVLEYASVWVWHHMIIDFITERKQQFKWKEIDWVLLFSLGKV